MMDIDYKILCPRARMFILAAARKNMETPTCLDISQAIDAPARSMTAILKQMEGNGQILIVRYETNANMIHHFEVAEGAEIFATRQRQKGSGAALARYDGFGGGPIARMADRAKAERLFLAVFRGEMSEPEAQTAARKPSKVAA